ncbi:hypothetical protein [Exiguobacterium acetylicum]|uniref:OB domain-containing protein n=1 Tax=Exiguobacterium acetylicum TaxID=41170 RepID=A0ABX8GFM3_EXIAC|nr:hypothetical protein [Exiguobacterium acetylicum]QWB31947.1 hypothetical protein KKI46_17280 [Exiguobacterium acetylicum]
MEFVLPQVKYLEKKNLVAKRTGNPFSLITIFDEKTYTKVDLFVNDSFNDQLIKSGDVVDLVCRLSDQGNISVVGYTM